MSTVLTVDLLEGVQHTAAEMPAELKDVHRWGRGNEELTGATERLSVHTHIYILYLRFLPSMLWTRSSSGDHRLYFCLMANSRLPEA